MIPYSPLISAIVTSLLTLLLTSSKGGFIQDIPNERSLHIKPVPRTGGIAIVVGIMCGWATLQGMLVWWIVWPVLGLFVLSLVDDIRSLTPRTRLVGHFIAALMVVLSIEVSALWGLPLLFYIVWMTNLYNFMDGSDGLAGGMALFGFGMYGVAALISGNEYFAMMNFAVSAAGMAFLFFNFYPARVFMGDAGSIPLGFLAAALGVWGWQQACWPLWFPLLVFSPFVADASLTLLQRLWRGERLSEAHRSHYYQKLVQMGWGHRNTALVEYGLMFLVGVSALWIIQLDALIQAVLLVGWGLIFLGLARWIDSRWRPSQTESGAYHHD